MAENPRSDSHISTAGKGGVAPKETLGGTHAVPMHHRLRLGQTDGVKNPQGVGQPSTKSTIANGGRNGW